MTNLMKPYDDALLDILENGTSRTNVRTKQKTLSIFGMMNRYKLNDPEGRFPILTRRKTWPMSVFKELIWFLSGSTNNQDLLDLGCKFWTPWVDQEFEKKHGYVANSFGPVYGYQLRYFGGEYGNGTGEHYGVGGFDQLKWVVERIKEDYSCRRTLWTLWNPQDVHKMKLPPCHMLYQVLVDDERRLTGIMYQRSCDWPIGVPANIQFYSALTVMLAQQTDCTPHEFVHFTADSHIYGDQIDLVNRLFWIPDSKTPTGRAEIPLSDLAVEAFRDQIQLAGPGPWLFPSAGSSSGHLGSVVSVR